MHLTKNGKLSQYNVHSLFESTSKKLHYATHPSFYSTAEPNFPKLWGRLTCHCNLQTVSRSKGQLTIAHLCVEQRHITKIKRQLKFCIHAAYVYSKCDL